MSVVNAFDEILGDSRRIVITVIMTNMLRSVIETTPEDLLHVVYLSANKIAAAHDGLKLDVLAEACGTKETHIKKQYKVLKHRECRGRIAFAKKKNEGCPGCALRTRRHVRERGEEKMEAYANS
uniref:DNA ligase 1-like n=1 Tax=Nicotiana sylvestris TaxID=4096 RepID=A0A1U7UZ24_NICSY|nr:PREDICTED: DNA ligase 1-like [Nicotiana sylvestris]